MVGPTTRRIDWNCSPLLLFLVIRDDRLLGKRPEKLEEFFPAYIFCEDIKSFDVKYWDNKRKPGDNGSDAGGTNPPLDRSSPAFSDVLTIQSAERTVLVGRGARQIRTNR